MSKFAKVPAKVTQYMKRPCADIEVITHAADECMAQPCQA